MIGFNSVMPHTGISVTSGSAVIDGDLPLSSKLSRYSVFCCLRVTSYGTSQISEGARNA